MSAKANPELNKQLRDAGSQPVQAIFQLQSADGAQTQLTDADTKQLSNDLLARVAAKVGLAPIRSNLLCNLRTLVVEAKPEFLKCLLQEPEIAAGKANQTKESAYIPPKGKRPVD